MPYTPTEWKNREVERPRTFRLQNNTDGTVTLLPAEGNIIEPGTPIIADNMNKIEQGIADAQAALENVAPKQHTHDASDIVSGTISVGRLPAATVNQFGVCKLYDGVDGGVGAGNYLAASPLAVKQVYDEMMLVKQSVVDGKGKVAEAINGMGGGPVSAYNTFPELAAGVNRISTGGLLEFGPLRSVIKGSTQTGWDGFDVFTVPAKAREVQLFTANNKIRLNNSYGGAGSYSRLAARNQSGELVVVAGNVGDDDRFYQDDYISMVYLNKAKRKFYFHGGRQRGGDIYTLNDIVAPPAAFDLNQDLTFYIEVYKKEVIGSVFASVSAETKLMYV